MRSSPTPPPRYTGGSTTRIRDGNGRATRSFMDAVDRKASRWLDYSAIPQDVRVQRSAFSIPALDKDRPQHHWLTTVFAVTARCYGIEREQPEPRRKRRQEDGYDLGLQPPDWRPW